LIILSETINDPLFLRKKENILLLLKEFLKFESAAFPIFYSTIFLLARGTQRDTGNAASLFIDYQYINNDCLKKQSL
jgi:hypothetical protein